MKQLVVKKLLSHFYQKIWDTVVLGILGLRVLGWFFLLTSKSGLRNTCPDHCGYHSHKLTSVGREEGVCL